MSSVPDATIKGITRTKKKLDATGSKILIVHTRWNLPIVNELVSACEKTLKEMGAEVVFAEVPGCYELPFACTKLGVNPTIKAVIAVGVLIKGETMHFEYIADATSQGLMRVGLDIHKPLIFGVLTCLNESQAWSRAGKGEGSHNHGEDWAYAAVEMIKLKL